MKKNSKFLAVDFLITQNCNYRCEYCSQAKKFVKGNLETANDEVIAAVLDIITPGVELTISGGEPLTHPKFFDLISGVIARGGSTSVVSNFSFPFGTYKKLKEISGEKLTSLFVSLHLTQVKNLNEFIEKAVQFNNIKGGTDFTIGAVLTDENCAFLKDIAARLYSKGIKFELQHLRIKNKFVEYGDDAKKFISNAKIEAIREKSGTYGKICRAGIDFAFIYQNGDAYRCYSSRFNRIHYLGNIKNGGLKLYKKPIPCLNKNCTCPKPIANNMIDFNSKSPLCADILSLYNALFIPYYAVKNFKIIKEKLTQAKYLKF